MGYSIFVTSHYTFSGDLRVYGVVAESISGIIKGRKHFSCYIARGQSVQSYSAVAESFLISISGSTFMVVKCSYIYKVKYP